VRSVAVSAFEAVDEASFDGPFVEQALEVLIHRASLFGVS
jgi:hypothetical protein